MCVNQLRVVGCRVYEQLKVPHEQLTLIPPQFETPLPPLQPAVSLLTTWYKPAVCLCLYAICPR